MMIPRAYKTKLRLTSQQRRYFGACAGAARFVFNWALADRIKTYEDGGKPNMYEQKKRFNALKDDLCPWIRTYPYTLVESEFANVDSAYKAFFRRVKNGEKPGFPKFKRRGGKSSFRLRGSIHVKDNEVKLPRIGWVKLAERDYIPTDDVKILFVTISERANDWFVSVQVEEEAAANPPPESGVLGVDVGIKSLAICSDGTVFENPKMLRKYKKKLARLHRELARRKKGGSNWKKTKKKISKVYRKIENARRHEQHNISRYVTENASVIVIEDLNVKGMMSAPAPKMSDNGTYQKNGRANKKGLNSALADVGLGELHRQIEYKADWSGIEIIKADRFYPSSKRCSSCGHIDKELKLSDRIYLCAECGTQLDRDLNAALNLAALAEGVKRPGLPVELDGLPSTEKQEGSGHVP